MLFLFLPGGGAAGRFFKYFFLLREGGLTKRKQRNAVPPPPPRERGKKQEQKQRDHTPSLVHPAALRPEATPLELARLMHACMLGSPWEPMGRRKMVLGRWGSHQKKRKRTGATEELSIPLCKLFLGMAQNSTGGAGKPQVLVPMFPLARFGPFWNSGFFEPQPNMAGLCLYLLGTPKYMATYGAFPFFRVVLLLVLKGHQEENHTFCGYPP